MREFQAISIRLMFKANRGLTRAKDHSIQPFPFVRSILVATSKMKRFLQSTVVGLTFFLASSEAHAVSPSAYRLIEEFPVPITNSMVMSWVISILVILGIRFAVGKPKLIPGKGQLMVENGITAVRDIIEPIVGKRMVKPTFPFLVGLFFFILFHNWSGLIPGVGAFGYTDDHGHLKYWMRPGNADLNMTAALGILSAVVAWLYFVLRYAGPKTLIVDLFGNKAPREDVGTPMWLALFPVFFAVGVIELISIVFRPVSLSFRLFGNVFGGENLLTNMTGLIPYLIPVPFYLLETIIGLVQALVFTVLSAVYIGLICNHGDGHSEHH